MAKATLTKDLTGGLLTVSERQFIIIIAGE